MGLSGEKGPLGENKREKEKRKKKGKEGGGAMGPRTHEGGAPLPLWSASSPLAK